eukprot:CAMPEP_0172519420 /NCGR_PEP_ID=MMETSP1066-20121228/291410_1 /TAXON_ID=671091 /ORGANISM="Coscinodiscus wailesii, Strain CCMP2513" /LENGTH=397 /DNA_ID=CAMNT_0013302007 /DNA_START=454 /DNA_END=1647 /DNA_ORIENTATION=-
MSWDEFSMERQQYWMSRNVTQDVWEVKHMSWNELSMERQQYWYSRNLSQAELEINLMLWDDLTDERKKYYKEEMGIISKEEWEGDWTWDELSDERRSLYESRGWTEEAWTSDNKSLLTMYNEEEMEWDDLSDARREYWISRGWTKEKWTQSSDADESPDKFIAIDDFNPIIIHLSIPELETLDMGYLGQLEEKVGLKDGTALGDNESFFGSEMTLRDYMAVMRQDQTKLYFQLEDLDHYKEIFQSILGDKIVQHLYSALSRSVLREKGYFKAEWDLDNVDFDKGMFDWSLFVGSTNTTTSMHYDTDLFNFLWVVEGRKRIIMIPNNSKTQGRYKLQSAYSGSGWTGIDILSRNYELPDDAIEVEIGAGEGIMFPYLCWHAVENLEPTVAYGLRVKED